jgi:hypothetical protein
MLVAVSLLLTGMLLCQCASEPEPYEWCLKWEGVWNKKTNTWDDDKCVEENPLMLHRRHQ